MTDDDPELARLVERMEQLRLRAERQAAAELTQRLQDTPDHHWPPAPNTEHPSFKHQAHMVRQLMTQGQHAILLPSPQRTALTGDLSVQPEQNHLVLTVHTVWGHAPYVGDPFVYVWPVAVDTMNRHIAGDAHGVMLREEWKP